MKQLKNSDLEKMISREYVPDAHLINRQVRAKLKLGNLIPPPEPRAPENTRLDLHQLTQEESWNKLMALATSGVRNAVIITGASGILRIKFQEWARDSLLSPFVVSVRPINNGSFAVKFKKQN